MADSIISPSNVGNGTFVFPSSSTDGTGRLLTESNIRDITGKIATRNYKVNHSDFTCELNSDGDDTSGIKITDGTAIISGYRIVIPNDLSLSVPLDEFDIQDGEKKTYNISLKLATQNTTGGYIADVTYNSDYGVVYIEFEEKSNEYGTISEYLRNTASDFNHYKPSIQRKSIDTDSSKGMFEMFDFDSDASVIPSQDELTFTSLNWVIKRYDSLFVNKLSANDNTTNISVLPLNKSEENGNPTHTLVIGAITLDNTNVDNPIQVSLETYDCTYRIDIDNVYVGNESLQSYLNSTNNFLKPFGSNTITSIRTPLKVGDSDTTGELKEIAYISTLDAIKSSDSENTTIDDDYIYFIGSYIGENYNEESNESGEKTLDGSNINKLQSIVECSFTSQSKEDSVDTSMHSSQVVSSASYNNCYTSYSYNLVRREYDESGFISKSCPNNKFFVGIKDVESHFSEDTNTTPSFGMYDKDKDTSILLSNIPNDNNGTDNIVELLTNSTRVVLSSNYVKSTDNTKYINNGNTFEISPQDSSFKIYNNDEIINTVGFSNDGNNKSVIEFTDLSSENQISSTIKLGDSNVGDVDGNYYPVIEFSDNVKVDKYIRADRVYNAVYNDYAEWYNSNNADSIKAGDVIYYDPITDSYTNHSKSPKTVVGVCSENYGVIVGGKDIPNIEDNRKEFVPVSLCGRVPVKVENANIFDSGDFVYASGSNYATNVGNYVIGKFLKKIDDNTALIQVYLG